VKWQRLFVAIRSTTGCVDSVAFHEILTLNQLKMASHRENFQDVAKIGRDAATKSFDVAKELFDAAKTFRAVETHLS
jgi:hypothetical protein